MRMAAAFSTFMHKLPQTAVLCAVAIVVPFGSGASETLMGSSNRNFFGTTQ
jgi:hypothetical protein